MVIRRLRTFNNNKRTLLDNTGYRSVKSFRNDNPEYRTNNQAYTALLGLYNDEVDRLNAEEERIKKEQKKLKAQQAKLRRQQARLRTRQDAKVKSKVELISKVDGEYSMNTILLSLRERQNQNIVWEFIDADGNVVRTRQYDLPTNVNRYINQKNVYLDFQIDSDTMIWNDHPEGRLFFYQHNDGITTAKINQAFREGITNCLLTPIKTWIEEKIEDAKSKTTKHRYTKMNKDIDAMFIQYDKGVPENDIPIVCDKLQIDIDITTPFSSTNLIEARSTKKALSKFRYLNTRLDHIELNQVVSDDNIVEVNREQLYELKQKLEDNNTYYTFNKDLNGVSSISTLEAKYQLNSEYMNEANAFETDNGLQECKIDDIHNKEVSEFVRGGVHYNGTIDFNDDIINNYGIQYDGLKHIDMTKAYANFKTCKYYDGFLGKITDFRETDKVVGRGMYYITDLVFTDNDFKKYNDKMKMYVNDNIYTDPELKMLNDYGVSYKIVSGCWGVNPIGFDFTDKMINTKEETTFNGKVHRIPYYSKWTGACNSFNLKKAFWINGDEEMVSIISNNCEGSVRRFWNGEIQVEYDKPYNKHLSHITAFITAYMRMNVIEQLLNIDIDNVIRVCCDGIYFKDQDVDLCNVFSHKTKMTFKNDPCESYCSTLNEYELVKNDRRKHYDFELHLGEGGCGKTHYNCNDKGLVRPLFLAPSWKLARAKERETGIRCSVWARALTDDPEKISFIRRGANTLIWDEVSMMSEGQKNMIIKLYGDMKNILCGDLGFQLPCITGEPMTNEGFDKVIFHKKDYRCKCPILKLLKDDLRDFIKQDLTIFEINDYVVSCFEKMKKVINYSQLKELYTIDDMVLAGTNHLKDHYTSMFEGSFPTEKYYIKSNNRIHSNGEIVIGAKPDKTECEVRHAFTTHSIQGETATHKLFIDSSKMFDTRMFYTAISRAKTIDQIYIVKDKAPQEKGKYYKHNTKSDKEQLKELTEKQKIANQKKGEKAYDAMVARKNKMNQKDTFVLPKKKKQEEGDVEEIVDIEKYSNDCKNECIAFMGKEQYDNKIKQIHDKK